MTTQNHVAHDGFRLRGENFSRLDAFSDVVFGFALTLLVVSVEVPRTYDEFHATLAGFFPFAICFFFFILVWLQHYRFFRRYGLHDGRTLFINSLLLFTVLFYVYPLKFLFSVASANDARHPVFSSTLQLRELMVTYGLGFAAIYLCFTALYWNAWHMRGELELSPLERVITTCDIWDKAGVTCIALLCTLIARLVPPDYAGDAGWFFFLIAPWSTVVGSVRRRRIRAMNEAAHPAAVVQ